MDKRITSFHQNVIGEQKSLLSFALRLTLDKDLAQDLVQETNLKALDNEAKFTESTNFKGWIHTIMRNLFLNNCRRKNQVVSESQSMTDIMNLATEPNDAHTPDSSYTVGEITEIIASFPPNYREPFNMHMAGYKYEEIAKALKMPLGTVKSHIFFTRRKLREMLKDF